MKHQRNFNEIILGVFQIMKLPHYKKIKIIDEKKIKRYFRSETYNHMTQVRYFSTTICV